MRMKPYPLGSAIQAMQIRDATPADRDPIIAFDHLAGSDPGRIQFIDRVLRSATCLVTEREGRVIAYAALEYTFYDNGFVSMVYVAEPERRRGVGRALMEVLAARCKTPKLFTSTNESNETMQELLRLLGFVPSGVIHNLDPGDPELVYFLDLGERAAQQRDEADEVRARQGSQRGLRSLSLVLGGVRTYAHLRSRRSRASGARAVMRHRIPSRWAHHLPRRLPHDDRRTGLRALPEHGCHSIGYGGWQHIARRLGRGSHRARPDRP